ncbi:MAG: type II toxin-antitoxin system VapC family toxin [Gemmatimonadota bacterium]
MIVADTDVLIDYLRGAAPATDRIRLELERGLATTAVSAFELWAGSLGSSRREGAVEDLLGALRIVPLDPASAKRAARIRYDVRSQGQTMAMADALIAGICVEWDAILLTRNRKHFEGVPHLALGTLAAGQ